MPVRADPARPPQIKSLADGLETHVRALVHSEPGVGKTLVAHSASIAPADKKTLVLVADPNQQSASMAGSQADKWEVNDWQDMTEAADYMAHEGFKYYDWWWLDSITHWQERGLDDVMYDLIVNQNKSHRKQWAADKGEYGMNMNRISLWCRGAIKVPCHFGITAHTMRQEIELDNGDSEVLWIPAIQGKGMPSKICSYMNIVGFMYAHRVEGGVVERAMLTEKDATHYAKDNWYGALGGMMVNPTIPKIMARIDRKRAQLESADPAKVANAAKAVGVKKTVAKKAVGSVKKTATTRSN